jgi:hypothetical protein
MPCGRWFDAVLVPREDGPFVLNELNDRSGAVIDNGPLDVFVWLVRPGAVRRWGRVARVTLLSERWQTIDVPPASWTAWQALRWVRPPAGDCLTGADTLLHGLIGMLKARGLPHPLPPVRALRRCACGDLVQDGDTHACVTAPPPERCGGCGERASLPAAGSPAASGAGMRPVRACARCLREAGRLPAPEER